MMTAHMRSATSIWLMLVGLTILSAAVAESRLFGQISGVLVVGAAALKARMIILDFMEARHAPPIWRRLFQTWLAAVCLMAIIPALLG